MVPAASGVDCSVQVVPFQLSAIVMNGSPGRLKFPTALQDVPDAHETAVSALLSAPGTSGVDGISQVLPFQVSTRVDEPLTSSPPAAVHAVGEVQEPEQPAPVGRRQGGHELVAERGLEGLLLRPGDPVHFVD